MQHKIDKKIARLKYYLAHDYEKIDYLVICEEALNKLGEIEEFIEYIEVTI